MIWVVKHAREEHKAVIEWLNNHTDDNVGFFLCEIKLYRIGGSEPAVKFEVVERPNDWTKEDLYNSLLDNKEDIEPVSGLSFDWRELPDRKASRIVLEKSVQFANKSQWESQFEWLADVMVKMKAAFCKYI